MKLQQISVFMENRAGQLAQITQLLSGRGIDLRALNVAESADYGVLRLIVSDPPAAVEALQQSGVPATLTDVVAVAVPDRPGGLCELLTVLAAEEIDISYMYSVFGHCNGKAHMIFRVGDADALEQILLRHGMQTDSAAELGVY